MKCSRPVASIGPAWTVEIPSPSNKIIRTAEQILAVQEFLEKQK